MAIDPSAVVRPIYEADQTRGEVEVRREYRERIEAALSEADPSHAISAYPEPWGGPKTGGPIPDQTYLVQLAGWAFAATTTIVLLVDFADVVRRFIAKAKALTGNDVAVSDGVAVLLAAAALFAHTQIADLALAFVTPLNEYLPTVDEMQTPFDGWLVGFRSESELYVAHVDRLGKVTLPDVRVPIDWAGR